MGSKIWNKKVVTKAVSESESIAGCLRKLNAHVGTSSYRAFKQFVSDNNIDTSHFTGKRSNGEHVQKTTVPLSKFLVIDSPYRMNTRRKRRLIREGLLNNKCYICGLTKWLGKNISLQIDHINGCHTDNRLENLRLLCPNCHSQTETYCGRKLKGTGAVYVCNCGKRKTYAAKMCLDCENRRRLNRKNKIDWPPMHVLSDMVENSNMSAVARQLGVSDTAIRKHMKKRR